jgi:hypothetical protein
VTWTVEFATGRPIGTERSGATSSGRIAWQHVNVVFSVGPYPLTNVVAGARSIARRTCCGESASPPVRICVSPERHAGDSSTSALKYDAVSHAEVTPSRRTSAASSAAVSGPGPATTQRPPFRSGAQISRVDASNDVGARWSHVSSGPMRAKSWPRTRRTMARCGTATPFGVPVEPLVNITYAASADPGRATSGAAAVSESAAVASIQTMSSSGRRSPGSRTPTRAPRSASMRLSLAGGLSGSSGAKAAPAFITPSAQAMKRGLRPRRSGTRSPARTPAATRAAATAFARRSSAA